MKNKAIAIALIGLMAISAIGMMPAKVKGDAEYITGYVFDDTGGVVQYNDSTSYYGVIYAHTSEDPTDWSTSQNNGGESDKNGYTVYKWHTTDGYDPFSTQPGPGDHLYLYGEALKDGMGAKDGSQPYNHLANGIANYTFCSNWTIDPAGEGTSPAYALNNTVKWESINVTVTSGSDWMNITVQAFRYTSYQCKTPNYNKGTYDNSIGFRAYVKDKSSGNTKTYNITNFSAGPNAPAKPNEADPGSTGFWWINLTNPDVKNAGGNTIKLANSYTTQVSALFTDGAGGTYETTGQSEPPITVPEFSTMLIPILATIGLFIAVTYIYRKKD